MFSNWVCMRSLTPCCSVFPRSRQGQKGGKEQSRDRASTAEGAAEPAARRTAVLSASKRLTHPRSRDPSTDPWNQESKHCLLPFLSVGRERRTAVLKFIPTAWRGRDMAVCLSVWIPDYSHCPPCSGRLKAWHTSSKARFAAQQSWDLHLETPKMGQGPAETLSHLLGATLDKEICRVYFQQKHNHHPHEQGGRSKIQTSKSTIWALIFPQMTAGTTGAAPALVFKPRRDLRQGSRWLPALRPGSVGKHSPGSRDNCWLPFPLGRDFGEKQPNLQFSCVWKGSEEQQTPQEQQRVPLPKEHRWRLGAQNQEQRQRM